MLGARRSRRLASNGRNPLTYAKQKEEPWILRLSTDPNLSPTSSTSCETSLASSAYMETDDLLDHVKLSPGSTSSRSQSPTPETVLQTNKYCGSAYVKALKRRHDVIDTLSEYEDPPLDHLDLSLSPSFESDFSIESQPSEMFQDGTIKEACEEAETTSSPSVLPSLPSRWPQSSWKISTSSRTISAIPTKLPAAVKKYLKKSFDSPSATNSIVSNDAASSNINETVHDDHQDAAAPSATTLQVVSSNASDTAESRKRRHTLKVKALARMRKERNEKRAEELKSNPPSPESITTKKPSKSFKDFVDHLLMVNATNELCRSPNSPNSPNSIISSGTSLPPVEKKRVSWKVDPELPKPTLERRTAVGSNLPKPLLRRNFANRFSSKPIGDGNDAAAPFDEEPFAYNLSSSGWKSVFMCGSGDEVVMNDL